MALPTRKTAAAPEPINFLAPEFYSSMQGIPEGDYVLFFDLMMHQFIKKDGTPGRGPAALKVRISAHLLNDPTAEPKLAFYSLGREAHKSYQPNPDTGKSLVLVSSGPGGSLSDMTNWGIFMQSLWASGMPKDIAQNDLTVMDGMWAHLRQVEEPESRKGMGNSKTGGAALDQEAGQDDYKPGKIAVVSEILEGGAPWEGGGGMPEAAPEPVKTAAKAPARPVAKTAAPLKAAPKAAVKAAPVEEASGELTEDDLMSAVVNALSAYFEKNPTGGTGVLMKTQVFKHVSDSTENADLASAVIDTYFADDATLNGVIEQFGYRKTGVQIKPVS